MATEDLSVAGIIVARSYESQPTSNASFQIKRPALLQASTKTVIPWGILTLFAFTANYLFLLSIKLCMSGVRINSIAKLILPPGTTMVLERDIKESWIMFRK